MMYMTNDEMVKELDKIEKELEESLSELLVDSTDHEPIKIYEKTHTDDQNYDRAMKGIV